MNIVLHKARNSAVITISNAVKEALGSEIEEKTEFVTSGIT
ncbi:hypothetical protein [Streptococcus hyointestinalis]|nr:hypothetical protein [Streptococcus hyointestinalis]